MKPSFFLAAFLLLSLANLASVALQWQPGVWATKPLLMAALAAWFFFKTQDKPSAPEISGQAFRRFLLAGLLFSMAGDTFLMFSQPGAEHFFLLGLGSFLVAHLSYVGAFLKFPAAENGLVRRKPWLALPLLAYLGWMVWVLWSDLPAGLKIPVLAYSLCIAAMALSCLNMGGRVSAGAFQMLLAGAVLFVLSDSLLALEKFKAGLSIPNASLLVMATYLAGQFLLAKGAAQAHGRSEG